jgi:hypothetical protein
VGVVEGGKRSRCGGVDVSTAPRAPSPSEAEEVARDIGSAYPPVLVMGRSRLLHAVLCCDRSRLAILSTYVYVFSLYLRHLLTLVQGRASPVLAALIRAAPWALHHMRSIVPGICGITDAA